MTTIIFIIVAISIAINTILLTGLAIYNIQKDRKSKEALFQIQMMAAESKSMKETLPVSDLYRIVDDTIKFYTARQLTLTNISQYSEQELSTMIDDIILTIASNVEMHLGEKFKSAWEVYFDPIAKTKEDSPSHLNLYIHENTKLILVRAIESTKQILTGKPTKNE